jgi:hypothetical protein
MLILFAEWRSGAVGDQEVVVAFFLNVLVVYVLCCEIRIMAVYPELWTVARSGHQADYIT